jgi:serine/threonine-protein kinase
VYSLGVVLWECLTGAHLVPRGSLLNAAEHIVAGQHPPASALRRRVPPAVDALLARALSTDPEERPCALELERILRRLRRRQGAAELARCVRLARHDEVASC